MCQLSEYHVHSVYVCTTEFINWIVVSIKISLLTYLYPFQLCRPAARLNRLVGRYDNPLLESTISPSQWPRIRPQTPSLKILSYVYNGNGHGPESSELTDVFKSRLFSLHFLGHFLTILPRDVSLILPTGRQLRPLSSVLYRIILKDVTFWPHNYSLEKNQVPREGALTAISLACLLVQWYSYVGSWKWVTILHILIGIFKLLFAICFCIPSYVHH